MIHRYWLDFQPILPSIACWLPAALAIVLLLSPQLSFAQDSQRRMVQPAVFQPGILSTGSIEYAPAFSAKGDELFFARSEGQWGKGALKSSIYYSRRINGEWLIPAIVPFSGTYDDSDPHLTKDGQTLFFISKRPDGEVKPSADIWMVHKDETGNWKIPVRLGDHINSPQTEYSPRTTRNGDLYFASDRPGGYGQGDLYRVRKRGSGFDAPINLGNTLNSSKGEWNLEINDRGDLIIFEASQRPQNLTGYGDLYISFKLNGIWTIPQNMVELNTAGSDLYAELTENEHFIYYASSDSLKSTDTQLYYTNFKPLFEQYKAKAIAPKVYLLTVNRSGHNLAVNDTETGRLIKSIPTGTGPHEISLSKNNRFAFVANYGSFPEPHQDSISGQQLQWIDQPQNTITRIDLQGLDTTTFTIAETISHHGIWSNEDGSLVWITAENEGLVKELNGHTGEQLRIFKTMPGSHIVKSNPDFSRLFVSNIESNSVSVINLSDASVQHISTPDGPEGMELSPDGRQLWVLCNSAHKAIIIDANSLEMVDTIDVQGKFPVKMTFVNDEVWINNVFSKNISVFDQYTCKLKTRIGLEATPLGITAFHDEVFITLPRKNLVRVWDAVSKRAVREFRSGIEPDGMVILNDVDGLIRE